MSEMSPDSDNSLNRENYLSGADFSSPDQLAFLSMQARSLYSKAQDPQFKKAFRGYEVSFKPEEHQAIYRHSTRGSKDEYDELIISTNEPLIAIKQLVSIPKETGRVVAKQGMIIDDQGVSYRSEMGIWEEDSIGLFRDPTVTMRKSADQKDVPRVYADTTQDFIDRIWSSGKHKILDRIIQS